MIQRWADVDLSAIRHNLQHIASLQPKGVKVIAVVKANAYGHGTVPVAEAALAAGAWGLAVSTLEEAQQVRGLLETSGDRLLVLGGLLPDEADQAARLACAITCYSEEVVHALAAGADPQSPLPVHLKVDTGLGRLGCAPEEAPGLARLIAESPALRLAGTCTHFASSESDPALTREQFRRFSAVLDQLGVDPGLRHAGNSGAALRYPEMALDAVRLGIGLYGCEGEGLRPALAMRGLVAHVKTLSPGSTVGYGATWRAERETRVATVLMGYADGVMRARGNRGEVLVRGRRAPLIGRVSMDAVTLDVSGIPEGGVGDTATFIGTDGEERITAEEVAAWSATNSYEALTSVGRRVQRRYSE
ncbi:MAG TPA: alanine racemase [Candidatus Dormibacteraeota bacterium]